MSVKTATDIKQHLDLLQHEKVLALDTALRNDPRYMADLEEEILECHTLLAIAAVTEVAVARAEHTGRLLG